MLFFMKNIIKYNIAVLLLLAQFSFGQNEVFTKTDSLRGSITTERAWWDLSHYKLDFEVNIEKKYLVGSNTITFNTVDKGNIMQIDLQPPMQIDSVYWHNLKLPFKKIDTNVYHLFFKNNLLENKNYTIQIFYSGNPKIAQNAPWDGGFSWDIDKTGKPFVATSCQGLGASVWWPCKDHMYDEVDSMDIIATIPSNLMAVCNGQLIDQKDHDNNKTSYHWLVKNPINNYGVNLNIGDYAHWKEIYKGEKGNLTCDYYALKQDLVKAKFQFKQVPLMLQAFEHWFGPYPFYEDGYKLVQVPYLGMEHQSSVTYGNKFMNGYLGKDFSGTGVGLLWDFIIVHESGHEWFANNITYKDMADMWIHESFTAYSETLFTEYHYGKEKADKYVIGTRKSIENKSAMITPYHVNSEPPSDIYFKGANMIHTLRTWLNDDIKFREILREMNLFFYHKTVTTAQIENFLEERILGNQKPFFDQYLRTTKIPFFEYQWKKNKLCFKWINTVPNFEMPLDIKINDKYYRLNVTTKLQSVNFNKKSALALNPNFYVYPIHKQ